MRNFGIAMVIGGLVLGAGGAMAQQMASATPAPRSEFVVFAEKGSHALSPTAQATVRKAASEASSASRVTLIGRAENVAPVKGELVKSGVPAQAIVVRPDASAPVAKTADGLSNPIDRRVEIKF